VRALLALLLLALFLAIGRPAFAGPAIKPFTLIVTYTDTASVAVPPAIRARFVEKLDLELQRLGGPRFVYPPPPAKPKVRPPRGYRVRATISERRASVVGRDSAVALVVQLTVSTFPEDHLRWIFTAKADAKGAQSLEQIEPVVLDAAIADAARGAMEQIDPKPKGKPKPKKK